MIINYAPSDDINFLTQVQVIDRDDTRPLRFTRSDLLYSIVKGMSMPIDICYARLGGGGGGWGVDPRLHYLQGRAEVIA